MDIEYEGTTYEFEFDDLDIQQAIKIEKHIGGTILDFERGLTEGRAICFQALGWAVLHGGDLDTPITSVNFKLGRLIQAFFAAVQAEQEAEKAKEAEEAEAGPTVAASTGPTPDPVSSPSG